MIGSAITWGLSLLAAFSHAYEHQDSIRDYLRDQSEALYNSEVLEDLVLGSMANYLAAEELHDLLDSIVADYEDEVVYSFSIGDSYEGRPIMAYAFMLGTTKDAFQEELISRRSVLIDGVHHARELTTISQVVFTMLSLLHGYEHERPDAIAMMENAAIVFIPTVNVDGFNRISQTYSDSGKLEYIRKNRRIDLNKDCRRADKEGVDLNRNYSYKFGLDNQGSGGSPCSEDYRGPKPFSEPETAAMRTFLLAHRNVKIAMNFHAWGPLFITPFNWDSRGRNQDVPQKAQLFYDEVYSKMPQGYVEGNGHVTIGYTANGEASDWMLHELGIYAMSPELGLEMKQAENFFIREPQALAAVITGNSHWIDNTMSLLFEQVICEAQDSHVMIGTQRDGVDYSVITSNVLCKNHGLMDSPIQDGNVSKNDNLKVSLLKVIQDGEQRSFDCPFEQSEEATSYQKCIFSLNRIAAQSEMTLSFTSFMESDLLEKEQSETGSNYSTLVVFDYLESVTLSGEATIRRDNPRSKTSFYIKDIKPLPESQKSQQETTSPWDDDEDDDSETNLVQSEIEIETEDSKSSDTESPNDTKQRPGSLPEASESGDENGSIDDNFLIVEEHVKEAQEKAEALVAQQKNIDDQRSLIIDLALACTLLMCFLVIFCRLGQKACKEWRLRRLRRSGLAFNGSMSATDEGDTHVFNTNNNGDQLDLGPSRAAAGQDRQLKQQQQVDFVIDDDEDEEDE